MSLGFVYEHKPAHNKSIIIVHAKPTTVLMDTKPYFKTTAGVKADVQVN